ncbi:MAG: PAS domain S-box protein [Chloroflexaceae bacterium]|nr:PAS domain S-box protein [Chloroflexaceae bacterium]
MTTTIEALQTEIAALRQRVVALEQTVEQLAPYQEMFEHMPLPAVLFRTDGMAFAMNRQNEAFIHTPREEVVAKFNILDDPESEKQGYTSAFHRALEGEVVRMPPTSYDTASAGLEGRQSDRLVWSETTYFPLRDETGTINYIVEVNLDVTARMQAEQELRQNQRLLQGIIDNAPSAIFVKDRQGRFLLVNRTVTTLVGRESDRMVGTTDADLFPPELVQTWQDITHQVLTTGSVVQVEETFPVRNEFHTYLSLYFPLYDEQQEIHAVGSIATDITNQQRQEQALRASEERLRTIIEKIPVGVCITSEQQRFEYANPAYCQIYHYMPDELIGQPFTIVVPPENRQHAADLHDAFMREGTEIRGEWHVVTREGTPLTVLADAAAIIGEDGRPKKVTFAMDITALKQAEQERLSLQQQVIEAQQIAIRELSTPLLPLAENVVALPLVGTIDSDRAQQVMETLLEGVAQFRAEVAIVDITGVSVVDSQVANALIQAAQAVNLLGARVVLTGIGPAIAQTLVGLGADLGEVVTRANLQSGIAYALNREATRKSSLVTRH